MKKTMVLAKKNITIASLSKMTSERKLLGHKCNKWLNRVEHKWADFSLHKTCHSELWSRKQKLMTTMQLWKKASHWSRTYFPMPKTAKYPPYPSTAKYPVWAQYSPVQPSAAQHSLGAPLQPNAAGKFPASLERFQPVWKVSSQSEKFPTRLESFQTVWQVSSYHGKFPDREKSFHTDWKVSEQSRNIPHSLGSFHRVWKVRGKGGGGQSP